jgi:hypothetical protein
MDQRSSFPGDILEALSCYLCCFLLLEGMGWIEGRTAMARVRETLGAWLGLAGFLLVSIQGGSLLLLFGEVGMVEGRGNGGWPLSFLLFNRVVRCVAVHGRFPWNFVTEPE